MDTKRVKQESLSSLYAEYDKKIQPMHVHGMSTHMVQGEGNPNAKIFFIGEAPGAQEDQEGRPFIGRSGKLLTSLLQEAGLSRPEVYISNIVKYRPPNNRKPIKKEIACGKELLLHEIDIVNPNIICTLGSSSLQGLLDQPKAKISQMRGTPCPFKSMLLIPTYHPAYILRNPNETQTLLSDLKQLALYTKTQ